MFFASDGPMPGDALEERRARGVELDADRVHAALDDLVELLAEERLVDVVLVLPDADAFGSTFTSSASGSWSRRAIETAPRTVRSRSGNSSRATSLAE